MLQRTVDKEFGKERARQAEIWPDQQHKTGWVSPFVCVKRTNKSNRGRFARWRFART